LRELQRLCEEHGWHALVEYVSPRFIVRIMQPRLDGRESRWSYVIEIRHRQGWRIVTCHEEISWPGFEATLREVQVSEIRAAIRGL
jgi:uncharacterized protein YmfQ (DUF2313 family)